MSTLTSTTPTTTTPNAIAAFSNVLLTSGERYLLLRRDERKRFAPGKWTGLGGRIEPDEMDDVRTAALRELAEEASITPPDVSRFALRRTLLHARPGAPLTLLLYFTGTLREPITPQTEEGTLRWLSAQEMGDLDVIDNTAQVLPLLVRDLQRDPSGGEPVRVGAARYRPDGELERIVWAVPEDTE